MRKVQWCVKCKKYHRFDDTNWKYNWKQRTWECLKISKVNKITDELEHKASAEHANVIQKATAYHKGYVQACEDFDKETRRAISQEQG